MQPQPNRRHQKLNDLLRDQLSDLLIYHTRDPRLATMVSVTSVELTPDMHLAKVFVSVMGDEEEKRGVIKALQGAQGYLRHEVGARVKMRHTPELQFHLDNSIERGVHLSQLLKEVIPPNPDPTPPEPDES